MEALKTNVSFTWFFLEKEWIILNLNLGCHTSTSLIAVTLFEQGIDFCFGVL